jgi:hypothetical protein
MIFLNKRSIFALSLLTGLGASAIPAHAEDAAAPAVGGEAVQIEGVDIPTTDVLDAATFSTTFRFYNAGGLLSRLIIGPFRRVNLGLYEDAQHIVGSGNPHAITPKVFFKLRFFDGTDVLPALALGYDNQGYLWQEATRDFLHEERGLYLVGGHEIFLPDFVLNAGVNVPQVEDAEPYGFLGFTWKIAPSFALLAEYDNIQNGPENRVNLGGRFWIIPKFNVDFAARNVGRGASRGGERIVRLNWTDRFPF